MPGKMSRMKIEAAMKGKRMPFDDQVLDYLLNVASSSASKELVELMEDFCPNWQKHERIALAALLAREAGRGDGPDHSSRSAPSVPAPDASDADMLAQDMALAQMLQEEEDAKYTNNPGQSGQMSSKKGKRAFKPLNINYTVARGGNAPPALGTAAPSSLADVLRQKRSQQVLDTGPPNLPALNAPSERPTPWTPSGLTWAEKLQLSQEPVQEEGGWHHVQRSVVLQVRVRANRAEHVVEATSEETVGDVKKRLEKMHGFAFNLQRLLHLGRELQDDEALQSLSATNGQIVMQLVMRQSAPRPANLQLRLQMPGGSQPMATEVPEKVTGDGLKEQIQREHGIRKDHLSLSFFGHPLQDHLTLAQQGVANGGCISVSLAPPPERPEQRFPAPEPPARDTDERTQLIQKVFAALNRSHTGHLNADEMRPFANQTGFEGSDAEWRGEFDSLRHECGSGPGISLHHFQRLVNDDSDAGCYCLDDELRTLLQSVQRASTSTSAPPPPMPPPKPGNGKADGLTKGPNLEPKRAAPQPEPRNRGPPAAPAAADGRTRLIEEVFTALNRSRTGNLNADEMRPFANQTGFQGSDAEWQTEFDLLRKECGSGSGISLHHFRHLVNDDSDAGCYCSDGELRTVLQSMQRASTSQAPQSQVPRRGPDYGAPNGDQGIVDRQAAAKAAKAINDERTQLIQEIFTALNRSRSGHLNADEMRPFGDQTGFEGTDAEWRQEFDLLRKECGSGPGISLFHFQRLANDSSDDGCYCSDEELRRLLQSLQGGSTSASMPPEPRNWAPAAKGNADERVQLIEQVFNTLNRSCTGYLNASEMRPFANRTGFDGTDAEWRQEFELLQKECGSNTGISLHHFQRLANDSSDDGCYCSDQDLRGLLQSMSGASTSNSAPVTLNIVVGLQEASSHRRPAAEGISDERVQLINQIFTALNRSCTGYLNESEMRPFANRTGFEGTDPEWQAEFHLLQKECGSGPGISLYHFQRLANDTSDDGCYCSDEDLRDFLQSTCGRATSQAAPVAPPEPRRGPADYADYFGTPNGAGAATNHAPWKALGTPERTHLIEIVFTALNKSGTGYLNADEMRLFANQTGFEGTDAEWREEFSLLARECGSVEGISLNHFQRLANDSSDDGCYCSDEDFRTLWGYLVGNSTAAPLACPAPGSKKNNEPEKSYGAATNSRSSHGHGASGTNDRTQLIQQVFTALNRSRTGYLNADELRPFANQTGFEGTDPEWQAEFHLLQKECGSGPGISLYHFRRLANDSSNDGCYCSDEGLRTLLQSMWQGSASFSAPMATREPRQEPAVAQASGADERTQLIQQVFTGLNQSRTGYLNADEMRPFANQTGFQGTDAEWRTEFNLLRQECGSGQGVSMYDFQRLANETWKDELSEEEGECFPMVHFDNASLLRKGLDQQSCGAQRAINVKVW
ncbi:unnamed protein product [Durusdinium trenchii]|uniref:Ubiquitin-like domain-containing protein n=1 Tax=Durusdinium trenchii TaxID=1381693 RepID=A0ABP0JMW5_9DINO